MSLVRCSKFTYSLASVWETHSFFCQSDAQYTITFPERANKCLKTNFTPHRGKEGKREKWDWKGAHAYLWRKRSSRRKRRCCTSSLHTIYLHTSLLLATAWREGRCFSWAPPHWAQPVDLCPNQPSYCAMRRYGEKRDSPPRHTHRTGGLVVVHARMRLMSAGTWIMVFHRK